MRDNCSGCTFVPRLEYPGSNFSQRAELRAFRLTDLAGLSGKEASRTLRLGKAKWAFPPTWRREYPEA